MTTSNADSDEMSEKMKRARHDGTEETSLGGKGVSELLGDA